MTQSGGSKFTIDQSSGAISLLAPLDYEALPAGSKNYELTVTATDGGALIVSPHKVGAGRGVFGNPIPLPLALLLKIFLYRLCQHCTYYALSRARTCTHADTHRHTQIESLSVCLSVCLSLSPSLS